MRGSISRSSAQGRPEDMGGTVCGDTDGHDSLANDFHGTKKLKSIDFEKVGGHADKNIAPDGCETLSSAASSNLLTARP